MTSSAGRELPTNLETEGRGKGVGQGAGEEEEEDSSSCGASDSLDIAELSALAEAAHKLVESGKREGLGAGIGRSTSEEVMGSRDKDPRHRDSELVYMFVCLLVCILFGCDAVAYTGSAHSKSVELSRIQDTSR